MTMTEARLSLQVEAEARVGWLVRQNARLARAREDAAWAAMTGNADGPR